MESSTYISLIEAIKCDSMKVHTNMFFLSFPNYGIQRSIRIGWFVYSINENRVTIFSCVSYKIALAWTIYEKGTE